METFSTEKVVRCDTTSQDKHFAGALNIWTFVRVISIDKSLLSTQGIKIQFSGTSLFKGFA